MLTATSCARTVWLRRSALEPRRCRLGGGVLRTLGVVLDRAVHARGLEADDRDRRAHHDVDPRRQPAPSRPPPVQTGSAAASAGVLPWVSDAHVWATWSLQRRRRHRSGWTSASADPGAARPTGRHRSPTLPAPPSGSERPHTRRGSQSGSGRPSASACAPTDVTVY